MGPASLWSSVGQAAIKVQTTQSSDPLNCETRRTTFWSSNSKNQPAGEKLTIRELKCFATSQPFSHTIRYSFAPPPSLTPAAMKKLVEKRNAQFCDAVNELLRRSVEHSPLIPHNVTDFWLELLNPKTPFPCYENLAGDLFLRTLPGTAMFPTSPQKSRRPRKDFLPQRSSKKCKSKAGTRIKYSSGRRQKRRSLVQVWVVIFRSLTLAPYTWTQERLRHRCRRPSRLLCPVRGRYPPFIATKQRQ